MAGPFFRRIEADPALARGYVHLLDEIDVWIARGRPDQAAKVRAVFQHTWSEFERLGARAAVKATENVQRRLRATAVRPPTSGRLEGSIVSRVIPTTFPGGAVGIGDIGELDRGAINPNAAQAGPYWRTQEYGYTGHIGRIVPGYFMPGYSRAAASEFRNHPYFEPVLYTKGTPAMLIQKPIPARHFLRDGAQETLAWHVAESRRIQRDAVTRLLRI